MCVYDVFNSFWSLYVCFNYVSIIAAHQVLQRLIVLREQLIVKNNRNYKTLLSIIGAEW